MVLSLSTQGYQSILLSVSMHQNEPVKQSDMLSFSSSPLSFFRLLNGSTSFPDLSDFSPPLSLIATCLSDLSSPLLLASLLSYPFLFLAPFSPCQKRLCESNFNYIKKKQRTTTRLCQWQFNP